MLGPCPSGGRHWHALANLFVSEADEAAHRFTGAFFVIDRDTQLWEAVDDNIEAAEERELTLRVETATEAYFAVLAKLGVQARVEGIQPKPADEPRPGFYL